MNENELNNNQTNTENTQTEVTPLTIEPTVNEETQTLGETNQQPSMEENATIMNIPSPENNVEPTPTMDVNPQPVDVNENVGEMPQAPASAEPVSAPTIEFAQEPNSQPENQNVDVQQMMNTTGTIDMTATPAQVVDTTQTLGETPTPITPDASNPQPTSEPTQTSPQPKKNNPVLVVVLLLIIIGAIGYAVWKYVLPSDKKEEPAPAPVVTETCSDTFQYAGQSVSDNATIVISEGKEYNFKAENFDLFNVAYTYLDNLNIKVCTKAEDITSYSITNKLDNTQISATNENELRTALGLKPFGPYTEKLTLLEIKKNAGIGIENEKEYTSHELKLKSATEEANIFVYKQFKGQADILAKLKETQQYTVEYEITRGISGIEYVVKTIK